MAVLRLLQPTPVSGFRALFDADSCGCTFRRRCEITHRRMEVSSSNGHDSISGRSHRLETQAGEVESKYRRRDVGSDVESSTSSSWLRSSRIARSFRCPTIEVAVPPTSHSQEHTFSDGTNPKRPPDRPSSVRGTTHARICARSRHR